MKNEKSFLSTELPLAHPFIQNNPLTHLGCAIFPASVNGSIIYQMAQIRDRAF